MAKTVVQEVEVNGRELLLRLFDRGALSTRIGKGDMVKGKPTEHVSSHRTILISKVRMLNVQGDMAMKVSTKNYQGTRLIKDDPMAMLCECYNRPQGVG